MKGILIIACGHYNYGRMAAALAATIRASFPDTHITLAYAGQAMEHLTMQDLLIFDERVAINEKYYTNDNGVSWLRPKLFLPEISPYDETIYLDCDMAWLNKSPEIIFELCKDLDFVVKNYSNENINDALDSNKEWAKASEIRTAYQINDVPFYAISTEVVYFKKTDQVKKLYKNAAQIFDNPLVEYRSFAGGMADELALNIACMLQQKFTGIDNFVPVFWRQAEKKYPILETLRNDYFALSMGGARSASAEQNIYNILVAAAYYALGISHPYKWIDKSRYLNERKKI